jgi:pilus assembly protein CpaF
MILLSGVDLPLKAIYEMIATAIHVIVQISRFSDGTRKITGITEVVGLDDKRDVILKDVFVFDHQGISPEGKIIGEYKATGYIPVCFDDFVKKGIKVDKKIFDEHLS